MRYPQTDREMWQFGLWAIGVMCYALVIRTIYDAIKYSC